MTQNLAISALNRAIQHRRPPPGLIHHPDRGSQYCAKAYRAILQKNGLAASLSRKGNCYDNAPIGSFWGSLKNEMVHHHRFETRAQAESAIREYIGIFYNRQRQHSRIGCLAPAVFAQSFTRVAT
ncbi:MAG: DDE-type integrase/transposase/recombinase [Proteobacteria bacterium]|nr:DDE-type integrase/transposase/recombinase [Pseudomonadota bacterium]